MTEDWNFGAGCERRKKFRISTPFPTRVRGVNAAGHAFEVESVLENLSSDGLYLKLSQSVKEQTKLQFLIRMSDDEQAPAPTVHARGVVLRAEAKPDGIFGLAVRFTHHRVM